MKKLIHSISFRIIVLIVLIMACAGAGMSLYLSAAVSGYVRDYFSTRGGTISSIIASTAVQYEDDLSKMADDDLTRNLVKICRDFEIYGIYLEVSEPPYTSAREILFLNENGIQKYGREDIEFDVSENERKIFLGEKTESYSLYTFWQKGIVSYMHGVYGSDGTCIAVAGVDFLSSDVSNKINADITVAVVFTGVIMFIILAVIILILHFNVLSPVKKLSGRMQSFVDGDKLNVERLPVKGKNEIARMAEDFNNMTEDISAYVKTMDSMNAAAQIQKGMLPSEHMKSASFTVDAYMRPARSVGGDFYDYFTLKSGRVCFVIADVSGKGMNAAMFMASAVNAIRYNAKVFEMPSKILEAANNDLAERNPQQLFVTAFAAVFDPETGLLYYSNAGHNLPYLVRDGQAQTLDEAGGLLLGLFAEEKYEDAQLELHAGDMLFMFTDGLNEAVSSKGEFFGNGRIKSLLEGFTEGSVAEAAEKSVNDFSEGAEQHDDITILAVCFTKEWSLELPAEISETGKLKSFIMKNCFIPEKFRKKVYLAAEEVFVNICRYAYNGNEGSLKAELSIRDDVLRMVFTDSGAAFNPLENVQDPETYNADNRIGGLGRLLAIKVMDFAEYEYKDGKNVLTLGKEMKNDDNKD